MSGGPPGGLRRLVVGPALGLVAASLGMASQRGLGGSVPAACGYVSPSGYPAPGCLALACLSLEAGGL